MSILKNNYKVVDGILSFKININTTKLVSNEYNLNPFPHYKNLETKQSLLNNGNKNNFSKELKKFIGLNKTVLEAGAGTCQLSNYLSISTNNKIFALDPTIESLKLGKAFADKNEIKNNSFVQGDILEIDQVFNENQFDFVYCSGVLHHTKDPYMGFVNLCKVLKKDGLIIIGLYNKFGRLRTIIRQFIYKRISKKVAIFLDPMARKMKKSGEINKLNAWIKDQYEHPVESWHSYDEILNWFAQNNIEFLNFFPNYLTYDDNQNYFSQKPHSLFFERILEQILMIFTNIGSEGGLFLLIGKKK